MSDGSVVIDVELKTDKARQQYKQFGSDASKELDKVGKSKAFNSLSDQSVEFAKKASLSIAAVGTAIAGFSIKAAGDMQAMNAQFSQVFGDMESDASKSLNKISKETNILPNRLKGSFTKMAAFAKTTGMDTADALSLTERATLAAADSAAFYDTSITDVTENLQSYLKGNYENDAALGISSTETTRNAAANKLYGKSFSDLSESQKQLTLLQMVEDGNKLSGALGQAAREGGGLENVFGNMKQAVTDLAAAFGAPLLQPFLDMVGKVSSGMAKLATILQKNPALVYVIVGAVTTLAAAFTAAYLAANNFAKMKSILSSVKVGFAALTSPVALVVLAIGALVTAFVYFYKTSDTFRAKVDAVLSNLKKLASNIGTIVKMIGAYFTDFGGKFQELRKNLVEALGPELAGQITAGMVKVLGPISDMIQAIKAIAGIAKGSITSVQQLDNILGGLFSGEGTQRIFEIGKAIKDLVTAFKNLVNPAKSAGKSIDIVEVAFTILKSVFLALLGPIGLVIKAFELIAKALGGGDVGKGIDMIVEGFDSLASGIQKNGPKIGTSAGKAIEGILTAIASALPEIITGGLNIIAALIVGIAQGLPLLALAASQLIMSFTGAMLLLVPQITLSATAIIVAFLAALTIALPQIIIAGLSFLTALINGITQGLPQLITTVATLITTFLQGIADNIQQIIDAGTNLLINFLQGVINNLPRIVETVGTLITTFLDAVTVKLPELIESGANLLVKLLEGIAEHLPDVITAAVNVIVAFLQGIAENLPRIISAAVDVIIAFIEGVAKKIPDIVDAGMDLIDALVKGVLQAQDRLAKAAVDLVNGMAENIRKNRGQLKNAGENLLSAIAEGLPGYGLVKNGAAIANGLLKGLTDGFEKVKSTVSGWADWISEHKGPISYDKKLLIKNGLSIVEGLNKGLNDGFSDVKSTVGNLTSLIRDSFAEDLDSKYFNGILSDSINTNGLSMSTIKKSVPEIQSLLSGNLKPESASSTVKEALAGNSNQIVNNYYTADSQETQPQIIEVHVSANINKKELSKEIAEPVQMIINRKKKMGKRARGLTN